MGAHIVEWTDEDPPTPAQVLAVVKAAGGLTGVNAASRAMGVAPPNFKRYRDRLTEIEVEGSSAVFVTSEALALGRELEAQRSG